MLSSSFVEQRCYLTVRSQPTATFEQPGWPAFAVSIEEAMATLNAG